MKFEALTEAYEMLMYVLCADEGDGFNDTRTSWRPRVRDIIHRLIQSGLHQLVLHRRPVWQQARKNRSLSLTM